MSKNMIFSIESDVTLEVQHDNNICHACLERNLWHENYRTDWYPGYSEVTIFYPCRPFGTDISGRNGKHYVNLTSSIDSDYRCPYTLELLMAKQ